MKAGEKTILIVEDDKLNQDALRIFLKNKYKIETCDSEKPFFNIIYSKKIDLIIMDISLNGPKNGLELTEEIKKHPDFKDIPIICLTAHTGNTDEKNAINAGADVFMTKPVSSSTLLQVVEDYLRET